jgi:peptidoglycan/LPS O-acetylase OafA/YrhL
MTFRNAITVAQKMELNGGHSTGFAYIRLFLSLCVVIWHTIVTSYGEKIQGEIWMGPYRAVYIFMLPMFFALSGFLVAASLNRCRTPISFLGLRALRIFPALVMEVVLCALLLGPLLTHLPLHDYFTSEDFRGYFLNAFGILRRELPGVFPDNPLPGLVNGQLWTIMAEIMCYVALAALWLAGLRYRMTLLVCYILLQGVLVFGLLTNPGSVVIAMSGLELTLCFIAGVGVYRLRHRIPWHWSLALVAFLAMMALLSLNCGTLLVSIPAAYFTIWLGLLSPKMPAWLRSNDYSYGIYLYSFPLQQVVATMAWTHTWYINALISLPLTLLAAVASWHLLEKHVLKHRAIAYGFENWLLAIWSRYCAGKPAVQDVVGE